MSWGNERTDTARAVGGAGARGGEEAGSGVEIRGRRTVFHAARHALLTKAPPAACSFAHAAFASATFVAHVLSPTSLSPLSVFPSTIPIFAILSSRDLAYPPISRQPRRSCDAREKPPVARRIHPN